MEASGSVLISGTISVTALMDSGKLQKKNLSQDT